MKRFMSWLFLWLTLSGTAVAQDAGPRPLLLFHGWGPPHLIGFDRYVKFLADDGFPADRIHRLYYDYTADLPTINAQLVAQLQAISALYPATTEFDVIGHSTGDFVSLSSLIQVGLIGRVHKFIGLSGIGHGWDFKLAQKGYLGQGEKTLSPAYNDYITDFYAQNAAAIDRLEKCSLFSPQDGLIVPYDSGRFADGHNVSVPDMPHLTSVKKYRFYRLMVDECYGGKLDL